MDKDQHEKDGVEGVERDVDGEIGRGAWAEQMPLRAERGVEDGVVLQGVRAEPDTGKAVRRMDERIFEKRRIVIPEETAGKSGEISEKGDDDEEEAWEDELEERISFNAKAQRCRVFRTFHDR